jgi:hypothetical protein
MEHNWMSWRTFLLLAWPAGLVGVGGVAGFWFGLNARGELLVVLILAGLALAALGFIADQRIAAASRFQAALDAYANREIVRQRRWGTSTGKQTTLSRARMAQNHSNSSQSSQPRRPGGKS